MSSGDYSRTEAWNLQLQARVRELEMDIVRARAIIKAYGERVGLPPSAVEFLAKTDADRQRAKEQEADMKRLLAADEAERKPTGGYS